MRHPSRLWPALAALLGGCSVPVAPTPTPPPQEQRATRAATSSPAAPPASSAAASPSTPPACLPEALRTEGKIVSAWRDPDDKLAFCITKKPGRWSDYLCVTLDPRTGAFQPTDTRRDSVELTQREPSTDQPSVVEQSNAGTLSVCDHKDCFSLRLRPPIPEPFDETLGIHKSARVPGKRRVVAVFNATRQPHGGTSLRVFDLNTRSQLSAVTVSAQDYPHDLVPLGDFAILTLYNPTTNLARTLLVDLRTLATQDLRLIPALHDQPVHPPLLSGDREHWGMADVRGNALVLLSASGAFERRVELPTTSDLKIGEAVTGPLGSGHWVVLQGSPFVGTIHLVNAAAGSISTVNVPTCPP